MLKSIFLDDFTVTFLVSLGSSLVVGLIYFFFLRRKIRGAGYSRKKRTIVTQFKPMKDISFMELIALMPRAPKNATMALLAQLDYEGKIDIVNKKFVGKKFMITGALNACERRFLNQLELQNGNYFKHFFSGIESTVVNPIRAVREDSDLSKVLAEKGLTKGPSKNIVDKPIIAILLVPALMFLILTGGFDISIYREGWQQSLMSFLILTPFLSAATMMIVGIFYSRMFKYTPKGLEVLDYYQGLKKYLKHAEKERNEFLQDKQNSQFLEVTPYLILFGLESYWTKKLSKYRYVLVRV